MAPVSNSPLLLFFAGLVDSDPGLKFQHCDCSTGRSACSQ
jgi:hypothetical protein